MNLKSLILSLTGSLLMIINNAIAGNSFVTGTIRIQALGPTLIRVEQRGPKGFEDRETFSVKQRNTETNGWASSSEEGATVFTTAQCRVVIPEAAVGLDGVRIETTSGELLCRLSAAAVRSNSFLPSPSSLPSVWVLGDSPRVIPSARGALPPPEGEETPDSGWELGPDAPDAYIFFPAASGYDTFRTDFLTLTGPVPLVPLYTLGLWYSRYYPYDESSALEVMDRFRRSAIPLDVFVLDTDWRVGASSGYGINRELFPDMARFIQRVHEKQVRIMLNDHPEPNGPSALDPTEMRYRKQGLTSLLEMGADLWWFDRNWHTHLQAPAPGLNKEVWGMRLYHDITQSFRPEERTLLMSNVDGINNGRRQTPSHPAAHRFPVWWTGDTLGEWAALAAGIQNGVNSGIDRLMPYVHEDLGGHHGQPDSELYVRYMQFGALSPVTRIHCSTEVHRYPWGYDGPVEAIVGDFFRLRYRLLPMLYAAAHEAHRTGLPLMRRCDLEWPDCPEAADDTQYLLGDDLLVAPMMEPAQNGSPSTRTVWIPPGLWQEAWSGAVHRGPDIIETACMLEEIPVFIRQGGMVCSIPLRMSTGAAVWPELILDAFIPEVNQETVRTLIEDDGISMAYQTGAVAQTFLLLQQTGSTTRLHLIPRPTPDGIRPDRRELTLRLHLPAGRKLISFTLQGTLVPRDQVRILTPSAQRSPRLFAGPGAVPPSEAGAIVEWKGEVSSAAELEWELVTAPADR
jgi:alpha-glucosidase